MNETRRRVVGLVTEITQAPPADVELANEFTGLPQWDSLMHLRLVLAVEEEFGTQFDIEEVTAIASLDDLVSLIAKKTAVVGS